MGRLIDSYSDNRSLDGWSDTLSDWKKKAEETFNVDIDAQVVGQAQKQYLKQIKPYMPWVRDKGQYLGCEIARGFEDEIPSIRFGGASDRQCSPSKKGKLNKKQQAAQMMVDPVINEFRIGIAEGAKGGMKARLIPYFIVLPLAGFFLGKLWAGRKR